MNQDSTGQERICQSRLRRVGDSTVVRAMWVGILHWEQAQAGIVLTMKDTD